MNCLIHPLNPWNLFQNVQHDNARQLDRLLDHILDEISNKVNHFI